MGASTGARFCLKDTINASTNAPIKKDSQHVFKNLEISKTSVKFLNFLDKITPYLNKHGNIKKACLFFGEKLVKYTNKF